MHRIFRNSRSSLLHLWRRVGDEGPFFNICQWPFTLWSGFVTVHVWQLQGQFTFIQWICCSIFPNNRKRLPPVSLATKSSIPHFIIHFSNPNSHFFDFLYHHFNRLSHQHAIDETAVFQYGIFGWVSFFTIKM